MTKSSLAPVEKLSAEEVSSDLFYPVILRVDYEMEPRTRSDLPMVQCIWNGTNTDDNLQRLMVFRRTRVAGRYYSIEDNNIDFVAFSNRRNGGLEQLQAVFAIWEDQYPDWLGKSTTIVTVDGRVPKSNQDRAFVDLALVRDLTHVYEGLRAEISLSRLARFNKINSRRANHNISDKRDWFRKNNFEADHFIEEWLAKDMLQAIDDLRDSAMTRLGKLVDTSLNQKY